MIEKGKPTDRKTLEQNHDRKLIAHLKAWEKLGGLSGFQVNFPQIEHVLKTAGELESARIPFAPTYGASRKSAEVLRRAASFVRSPENLNLAIDWFKAKRDRARQVLETGDNNVYWALFLGNRLSVEVSQRMSSLARQYVTSCVTVNLLQMMERSREAQVKVPDIHGSISRPRRR